MLGRRRLDRDERGASSVEYGLIVFAIAAAIVVVVAALGTQTLGLFDHTCKAVKGGIESADHQPATACN